MISETIEYRATESVIGGQAVLAVGYDDDHLVFRNSWGSEWGDGGYGRFPVELIRDGYADDFWVAFMPHWLTDDFRQPSVLKTGN